MQLIHTEGQYRFYKIDEKYAVYHLSFDGLRKMHEHTEKKEVWKYYKERLVL